VHLELERLPERQLAFGRSVTSSVICLHVNMTSPSLPEVLLHEFLRAQPSEASRPDLAVLAHLEWARSQIFDAEDGIAATPDALAWLATDGVGSARLAFLPATRLLDLEYDVAPLWLALESGESIPPPSRGAVSIAVWRRDFDVLHAGLEPLPAEALRRARAGASLSEICEVFIDAPGGAGAAFAVIGGRFADGWVG
jgi:hypothetical protein